MNTVLLFINLMFSLRKNLFFERFAFLKSNSAKKNTRIYFALFFLREILFPIALLLLLLSILHYPSISFTLICAIMLLKLIRIDNYDWKLYSRDDFRLAYPAHKDRYIAILTGNMLKGLLIDDFTPLYIPCLVFFAKISFLLSGCIYLIFLLLYVLTLNYYFLLQTCSVKAKRCYALLSYVGSMAVSTGVAIIIMDVIIRFVRNVRASSLSNTIPMLFSSILSAGGQLLTHMYCFVMRIQNRIWLTMCIIFLFWGILSFVVALKQRNRYESSKQTTDNLPSLPFAKRKQDQHGTFESALLWKENRLFSYLYQYQFRQYWFVVLFDRSFAILIGLWAALYHHNVASGGYLLFAIGLLLFSLELSSQVNVKFLANLSFVTDYATLRLSNTNGVNLNSLVRTKLLFFYQVRSLPTLVSVILTVICLITTKLPIYLVAIFIVICFIQFYIYPKVFFTNNLINTRLDYSDFEKYLEESKLLDTGSDDFFPIALSYRVRALLVFASIITGQLLNHKIWIYIGLAVLLITIGLFEHCLMRRILRNILNFIQRGDYSADVKKIFSQSNRKS